MSHTGDCRKRRALRCYVSLKKLTIFIRLFNNTTSLFTLQSQYKTLPPAIVLARAQAVHPSDPKPTI